MARPRPASVRRWVWSRSGDALPTRHPMNRLDTLDDCLATLRARAGRTPARLAALSSSARRHPRASADGLLAVIARR